MRIAIPPVLKWSLLGLLAVLALAVLIIELMSWNFLKSMIAERVEAATGRSLEIRGNVSVSLFPKPHVTIGDLQLANPEWADASQMLEVDRIYVAPAVFESLAGNVALKEVEIAGVVVNLERQEEGDASWRFRPTDPPDRETGEDSGFRVSVDELDLVDARVNYRGPELEEPLTLSVPSLEIQDDGESLTGKAEMSVEGRALSFDARGDSLDAFWDESMAFAVEAALEAEDSGFDVSLALPDSPDFAQFEAEWELAARNLSAWSELLGGPPIDQEELASQGRVEREDGQWRVNPFEARFGESHLAGALQIDPSAEPLSFSGRLRSSQLDVAALIQSGKATPDEELAEGEEGIAVPVLPDWRGDLSVAIDRLLLEQGEVTDVQAGLSLAERTLEVDGLEMSVASGTVEASGKLQSGPEEIAGAAKMDIASVDLGALEAVEQFPGVVDARLAMELRPVERRPGLSLKDLLTRLEIERSQVSYAEPESQTELVAELSVTEEAAEPVLSVDGTFRGRTVEAKLTGDPLEQLETEGRPYSISADIASNGLQAQMDTTLSELMNPQELALDLQVKSGGGQGGSAGEGGNLPGLAGLDISAQVRREGEEWKVSELQAQVGESKVTGSAQFRAGERPSVDADLEAERLDLASLLSEVRQAVGAEESGEASDTSPVTEPNFEALRSLDGQVELDVGELVLPGGTALREVDLRARLDSGQLRIDPLRFEAGGGSVWLSLGLDASEAPATGEMALAFEDVQLGRISDTFTPLEERLGRMSGEVNLSVTQSQAGEVRDDALLPFVGRVTFDPSELRLKDEEAGTDLAIQFQTVGLEEGEQRFRANGDGRYDGAPFALQLYGDPILALRDPDRPYSLELQADAVETQVELTGTLLRPLALKGLDLRLDLQGPNPQRLTRLLGVPLPELPPYSVSGDLSFEDGVWAFRKLEGRVGDSDLSGYLAFDGTNDPPRIEGDLWSDSLDLDDLGGLVGSTPGQGEEQSISEQQAEEAAEEAEADDRFVLPDEPIVGEAWDQVSADVRYRGRDVRVANVPLTDLAIDFSLEGGRMALTPVRFGVGEGEVDFDLELNARADPPEGTLSVEARRVDLRKVFADWDIADESFGIVAGRGKFWVKGVSIAELLGSADGGMVFLMTEGRLDDLLVELAGLDAGEAFLSLTQEREKVQIYCAYADVQVRDGLARLDTFVVDTDDTTFTAGGKVDFAEERLDITIAAHPKDASVLVGRTPLHLGGTFADLEPGLHGAQLGSRLAASAALAAVGGPVAALAPLLDLGTGEDTGLCDGLMRRTKEAVQDAGEGQ